MLSTIFVINPTSPLGVEIIPHKSVKEKTKSFKEKIVFCLILFLQRWSFFSRFAPLRFSLT